jgi:hypothetical protein
LFYPTPAGGELCAPCSILLCASSSSAESKTLPQAVQRCCFGAFEPAAAVDIAYLLDLHLIKGDLPARFKIAEK